MNLTELLKRHVKKIQSVLPTSLKTTPWITGYAEKRDIYTQPQFANRCIHLGMDIELPAGTEIICPLDAIIHSFANNNQTGDYGPTLILQHQLEGKTFYSLYGHLSRIDLLKLREGQRFLAGEVIGHIGTQEENGGWPPHLHLQLITDIGEHRGDYPGVCAPDQTAYYLQNCPNPEALILLST
jgi:murein DD-endopeptidase MepM/ murein hydrolase activator NlpD